MMKKADHTSIKNLIFNQVALTVEDLYAKRNALLAVEESEEENNLSQSGQIDLTSEIDLTSQPMLSKPLLEEASQVKFASQLIKLTSLPPWEKAQLESLAEELFYITLATGVDVGQLSMQTLSFYCHIVNECGQEHAMALFLMLLPKATDNPTGYISSAYKQGAEPTSSALAKAKKY